MTYHKTSYASFPLPQNTRYTTHICNKYLFSVFSSGQKYGFYTIYTSIFTHFYPKCTPKQSF